MALSKSKTEYGPERPADNADEGDFAAYARALWDEQENALSALHQVWIQNLLFLSNRQWHKVRSDGLIGQDPAPSWRKRPSSNLTLAYFKTFVAKATKVRPAWEVIPASTEPDDVKGAQLADEILEAKWLELRLASIFRRAVAWAAATGNGFLYPYWNENSGRIKPLEIPWEVPAYDDSGMQIGTEEQMVLCDEDGRPFLDEKGFPDPAAKPVYYDEGEVGIRALSPFQVRVNPEAECDDDVTWFIVGEAMTLREIAERWPDKCERVHSEDTGRIEDFDKLMSDVVSAGGEYALGSPADMRDEDMPKALVLHYHERQTAEHPNGRYWVSVNQGIELEEPQDLPDGFWPALLHLSELEIPGRYYAMSTLENVVGLNREYNELNGTILEHNEQMARGKWIADKGSGVTKGSITTEPGQVIVKNPGFNVEQAQLKPLPQQVYAERDRITADFERVSGVHRISMGSPPPGVTSGVAFLQLQEADDTDMGPFLANVEEAVAGLARSVLAIIKARYIDERLAYVAGPDRKYLVRSFRGVDLEGAVDVVPVAESSFPWSKTARQNMLLELAGKMPQLFQDAETGQFDTAKFARQLPIGGLDSFASGNDLDVNEAQREEEIFRNWVEGEGPESLPMAEFWQNQEVHYNSHALVLKSAEFREWPEEAQQAYLAHVADHDQKRMMARMAGTTSAAGQQMMMEQQQAAAAQQQGGAVGPTGEVVQEQGPPPEPAAGTRDSLMPEQPLIGAG